MKRIVMCVLVLCMCMLSATALAAKKTGSLQPEDFAYKGVALGDDAASLAEKLGEADFDTDIVVLDQTVKTYGSTRAKLLQVYGKGDKLKRDGEIYYVYRNPEDEKQKLMLSLETTNYYVESFLITSLPLTEEEQAEYDMGEFPTELEDNQDDNRLSGGFNSRGEWWAQYRVNDHITVGI